MQTTVGVGSLVDIVLVFIVLVPFLMGCLPAIACQYVASLVSIPAVGLCILTSVDGNLVNLTANSLQSCLVVLLFVFLGVVALNTCLA